MYGPPGIAYVYLVYGMHECLNVVTEPEGRPAAVLIRAVEPVAGTELMREARITRATRRSTDAAERARIATRLGRLPDARLAAGPGLVAAAFDITRGDTGADLLDPGAGLRLEPGSDARTVLATPRVGISYAEEPWRSRPWRLIDADSPAVSGARPRGSAS